MLRLHLSHTYIPYIHTYLNQSLVCGAQVEERERLRLEALGGEQGVEKRLLDSQARTSSSNLLCFPYLVLALLSMALCIASYPIT